jgi:gliding motility-associated-like protein
MIKLFLNTLLFSLVTFMSAYSQQQPISGSNVPKKNVRRLTSILKPASTNSSNYRPTAECLGNTNTTLATVCEGEDIELAITDSMDSIYTDSEYVWQWSLPNGGSLTGQGMAGNPIIINNFGPDNVGFYLVIVSRIDNSCNPILFIAFDLNIKLKKVNNLPAASVCEGQPFTWPDGTMANTNTPGNYPRSFLFTSVGMPNCPNDSTVNITLTVKAKARNTINATFCEGTSFTLPAPITGMTGQVVTTPGTYSVIFPNRAANGCDSTLTINLSQIARTTATVNGVVCPGKTYALPNGELVSMPGTYIRTLRNVNNCDSVITFILTAGQNKTATVNRKLCPGGNLTLPNGSIINSAGLYVVPIPSVDGCDSTITTIVTDYVDVPKSITLYICAGGSVQLPDGSFTNVIGARPIVISSVDGCDSTIIVDVRNGTVTPTIYDVTKCFGETHTLPNGNVVNTSGVYDVVYKTVNGCDSLVRTNLIVYPEIKTILPPVFVCEGPTPYVLPDGSTASSTGIYTVKSPIPAATGCDSLLVTDLTVFETFAKTINVDLCASEVFTLPDGTIVNSVGTYVVPLLTVNGCDSVVTFNVRIATVGKIQMATAFTPNYDGKNDCFGIQQQVLTGQIRFVINDRWGRIVHESNQQNACWDGKYKGVEMPIGTYIWTLYANTPCGVKKQEGVVTLIR